MSTHPITLRQQTAYPGMTARYGVYEGHALRGRLTVWRSGRIEATADAFEAGTHEDLDAAAAAVVRTWHEQIG